MKHRTRYNVIVIGGGTAGLVTAAGVAGLGGRVALVERGAMGGDCLNYGCVPSKALIASAAAAHMVRHAGRYGIESAEPGIDLAAVLERLRHRRAQIAPNDSVERFEAMGVDVFSDDARLLDAHRVDIAGKALEGRNLVIATGTRPRIPPIPGLDRVAYHTNETVFDQLAPSTRSLAIIGGGPIGCELGQAFQRLGVQVHLFQRDERLLTREDADVSSLIAATLRAEGVTVHCGTDIDRAEVAGARTRLHHGDVTTDIDTVLVAVGRAPNIESLHLAAAGVDHGPRGIRVDRYLRTNHRHTFAAGDITGHAGFTHAADAQARVVVRNVTFPLWLQAWDGSVLPRVTYTDPEVATVGMTQGEAASRGLKADVWQLPLERVDRAIVSDQAAGFARILTAGGDRIVGATVVAAHAGELIHEIALAMKQGMGLRSLSSLIHAYPTLSEIHRKLGDASQRSRLTARRRRWLARWFACRRGGR